MGKIVVKNPRIGISVDLEKSVDLYFLIVNHYDSRYGYETTHYETAQTIDEDDCFYVVFGIVPVDDSEWTNNDITLVGLKFDEPMQHFYSRNKEQEIITFVPNRLMTIAEPKVRCHSVIGFDERHGESLVDGFTRTF
jgi:hypothetical protein